VNVKSLDTKVTKDTKEKPNRYRTTKHAKRKREII